MQATIDLQQKTWEDCEWDRPVPIVQKEHIFTVYITESIESPFIYSELIHLLKNAKEYQTIMLHLNTPGGNLDSAISLINAIRNSKAKVVAVLSGIVASAGTLIALACKHIEVEEHIAFMIHYYSGGASGKGHELKAQQAFSEKQLTAVYFDIYKNFLTDQEIQEVIDGKDMWLTSDEVNTRITAKNSIKNKKA